MICNLRTRVRLLAVFLLLLTGCASVERPEATKGSKPSTSPTTRPAQTTATRTPEAKTVQPTLIRTATASPTRNRGERTHTPKGSLAERIPVLEYHDTEFKMKKTIQMKTAWFLDQMEWLDENGFQTLTGEQLRRFARGEYRPPQRSVVLRFDIGLPALENYREVIIPALEEHGFHALVFVVTKMVKDTCADDYICWSQLKEWEESGTIEVGSHGVEHPDYREIDLESRLKDAAESQQVITEKLGHPVDWFDFPYDSVPDDPEALLKPLGYELAFAGYRPERSVRFDDPNPYALPAYYVYSGEESYPVITGTGGLTFGEMLLKAVEGKASPLSR